ncbi:hypothetical protein INR49_006298 [Caranx melampygus]|nr:hypothetical protein INR49_006298 [Caranx melampygus]
MWTSVVQDLYQDFLHHVTVLSDWNRDPTDPDDQDFKLHLDQFQVQVLDLERRLVSVLGGALETCSSLLSAAKLVSMFRSILNCPVIQNQLRPHLVRLVEMVLMELDQTELLFYSHRERPESLSRFSPAAAAGLRWIQQLRLRAEDTMRNYETIQHLCVDSAQSHQVRQRFQQVVDLLQDFRDRLRSDWSSQLDWDCGLILEQPLVQLNRKACWESAAAPRSKGEGHGTDDCHPSGAERRPAGGATSDPGQLEELNQALSELQRKTWGSEGVQQLVEQHRHKVLVFHSSVMEARANMEAMTKIIQGWVELHLLQSSGEYLDHIDDKVQDGLFQLLLRALHFLSENTHPQSDRQAVMQEFLTYSRQLGPEELEAEETPPTLKDFQREIDLLHRLGKSLQQVTRCGDEDSSCSSSFPLTETTILLEAAGVELPEHLSAQLHVDPSQR